MDLQLYLENIELSRAQHRFTAYPIKQFPALLFAKRGLIYDSAIMAASLQYLKKASKAFSPFRLLAAPIITAQMSLSLDGVQAINDAERAYAYGKSVDYPTLIAASAAPFAAWDIAMHAHGHDMYLAVDRARRFYSYVKSKHSVLASSLDAYVSCWVALSSIDLQAGSEFAERSYKIIRSQGSGNNMAELALSELVLISGLEDGPDLISDMRRLLFGRKAFAKRESAAAWGTAALFANNVSQAADIITEIYYSLKRQRDFRFVTDGHTLSIASLIYCIGAEDGTYPRNARFPSQVAYSLLSAVQGCVITHMVQQVNSSSSG